MDQPCRRFSLATSPMGAVERCSCGLIHVSVGPFSLRLEPPAFFELAGLMTDAAERLRLRRGEAPAHCDSSH